MRLFLPPSETKISPRRGLALDLESLTLPELTDARLTALEAVAKASREDCAPQVFGVSEALLPAVRANADWAVAPTAKVLSVYDGVLYGALGFESLSPAAKRRAGSSLLVFSALFGVLSPKDRIPAYRASGTTKIPTLGADGRPQALNAYWRSRLGESLDQECEGHMVVDARSGTYASMYSPTASDWVTLDVLQRRGDTLSVVSHFAKHTRGHVMREILEDPAAMAFTRADDLAAWASERWSSRGWGVELAAPAAAQGASAAASSSGRTGGKAGGSGKKAVVSKPRSLRVILPEDHSFAG